MKSDKKEKPFRPLKLRDSQGAVSNPLAAICRKFTHKRIETMLNGKSETMEQASRIFGPLPYTRMYLLGAWFGRLLRRLGW